LFCSYIYSSRVGQIRIGFAEADSPHPLPTASWDRVRAPGYVTRLAGNPLHAPRAARVFFTESIVEKRRPLGPQARRAGWVGCNILLNEIPKDGKITVVSDGAVSPDRHVRAEFARTQELAALPPNLRGWTVDVLNIVRKLKKEKFFLRELYDFETELRAAHPRNQNVLPKIRQQLQVLRDLGIVEFHGHGSYSVRN